MTYTPPVYPTQIPTYATDGDDLPPWYDDLDTWNASKANALRLELCAALSELGTLPAGPFDTVSQRLDRTLAGVVLQNTDDISYTQATYNTITCDSASWRSIWDDGSFHSFACNSQQLSVAWTGRYLMSYRLGVEPPYETENSYFYYYINATRYELGRWYKIQGPEDYFVPFWQVPLQLTAGDTISLAVYVNAETTTLKANMNYWSLLFLGHV